MARRRKNNSTLDLIITGSWKVSAGFALIILIFLFIIIPLLNNQIINAVSVSLRPFGLIVIGILILTSIFKFLLQNSSIKKIEPVFQNSPAHKAKTPVHVSQPKHQNNATHATPINWSLKLIQEIEWKKFEELATAYYLEKGIRAEATSLGADGGIDIKLYQDESGKPTSLVQCKAWSNRQVGVKEIREFLGVLTHEKIVKGFYMTSGVFSEDAIVTAKSNGITLMNGELFLLMIQRLSTDSQNKLFGLATAGDYKTPSCSQCGVKMVRRKIGNTHIWGCVNFPKCRQKIYVKKSEI